MSNSGPKLEVQVTGQFDFTAEQVFDALMDPQRAGRFMFAAPGSVLIKAEIDPRVGGRYLFIEEREGRRIEHGGEYLHIERPRRLAFTLEVAKGSHVVDTVEILIERLARGCRVTVTHRMSAEFEKYAKQAQRGCSRILQGLAGVLGEAGTGE